MNISGAGVLKNAPHREAAVQFLEYLASDRSAELFRQRQQRMAGRQGRQARQPGARLARHIQDRYAQHRGARQEPAARAEDLRPRRLTSKPLRGRRSPARRNAPLEQRAFAAPIVFCSIIRESTISGTKPDRHDGERRRGAPRARRSSACEVVGLHGERVEVERPHHERRGQLLHHVDEHQQRRGERAAPEQRRVHARERRRGAQRRASARRRPCSA